MASRMTKIGCSINSSAIYKIEKSDPPRRITVDELVGFSQVLDIPVDNLLLPPELAAKAELLELLTDWEVARRRASEADEAEGVAWEALKGYIEAHPIAEGPLETALSGWANYYYDPGPSRQFAVARKMWELTESKEWGEKAKAALDALVAEGPSNG